MLYFIGMKWGVVRVCLVWFRLVLCCFLILVSICCCVVGFVLVMVSVMFLFFIYSFVKVGVWSVSVVLLLLGVIGRVLKLVLIGGFGVVWVCVGSSSRVESSRSLCMV